MLPFSETVVVVDFAASLTPFNVSSSVLSSAFRGTASPFAPNFSDPGCTPELTLDSCATDDVFLTSCAMDDFLRCSDKFSGLVLRLDALGEAWTRVVATSAGVDRVALPLGRVNCMDRVLLGRGGVLVLIAGIEDPATAEASCLSVGLAGSEVLDLVDEAIDSAASLAAVRPSLATLVTGAAFRGQVPSDHACQQLATVQVPGAQVFKVPIARLARLLSFGGRHLMPLALSHPQILRSWLSLLSQGGAGSGTAKVVPCRRLTHLALEWRLWSSLSLGAPSAWLLCSPYRPVKAVE